MNHLITPYHLICTHMTEHKRSEILIFYKPVQRKSLCLNWTHTQAPVPALSDFLAAPLERSTMAASIQLSREGTLGLGRIQIMFLLCGHLFGGVHRSCKRDDLIVYSKLWCIKCWKLRLLFCKGGTQSTSALHFYAKLFYGGSWVTRVHHFPQFNA